MVTGACREAGLRRIAVEKCGSVTCSEPIALGLNSIDVLLNTGNTNGDGVVDFFQVLDCVVDGSFKECIRVSNASRTLLRCNVGQAPIVSKRLGFTSDGSVSICNFSLTGTAPSELVVARRQVA